ncbi:hypothetical protein HKD37_03G007710 [Glycine soja]
MPPSSTIPSSMQYFIMIPISSGEWNAKIYNSQLVDIEDMKAYAKTEHTFSYYYNMLRVEADVGRVYMEVLNKVIKDTLRMANTHNILEFNRCDARFLVQETINPREVRPARDFRVRLDERWCDCCKL